MEIKHTYKGKTVFVTGHTGFKGSWLVFWLHQLGAKVVGYALEPNTTPSLYQVMSGDTFCKSIVGDIRDVSKLHQAMADCQPDFVFHLAAQPLVRESYNIPAETFEVNAIGTANVLDGIRMLKKPCVGVMITTDKVYENNETGQAYKESDRLGGYDPYSASKACAEIVIDSYRKSFFNPKDYDNHHKAIASARAGNVIGGGDWAADRLIPDVVRALSKNEPVVVRNPQAVRPWQHVLEPLYGYLTLGAKLFENPVKYAEGFNFGPQSNDVLTVDNMVQMALEIWDCRGVARNAPTVIYPQLTNQPHEAGLLSLDISKAKHILDWQPRWNAKQALEQTLTWYKTYYQNGNVIDEMTKQITNYEL